jgi:hypothetical protein
MQSALRVAAIVLAFVARLEPALVGRIGPPEQRDLPAHWLRQGNMKAKGISSVLGTSQSILLRRGRMSVSRLLDLSSISWPGQWRCLIQIAEL